MRASVWPSLTSVASGTADLCPPLAPAPSHCKTPYLYAFHKATYSASSFSFFFKHRVFALQEMVPALFPHHTQPWPLPRTPYSLLLVFQYLLLVHDNLSSNLHPKWSSPQMIHVLVSCLHDGASTRFFITIPRQCLLWASSNPYWWSMTYSPLGWGIYLPSHSTPWACSGKAVSYHNRAECTDTSMKKPTKWWATS